MARRSCLSPCIRSNHLRRSYRNKQLGLYFLHFNPLTV